MKRILTTLLVVCLASSAALAAPMIHAEETRYDFGTVQEGVIITHAFVIENVGDEPLEITGVRASCGCTTTALATNILQPGESVDLEARLNTNGFGGYSVNKTIYVYSNDPTYGDTFGSDLPLFILRLTGQVVKLGEWQITASDLDYLMYALVDVREPAAYASGHLLGAVNMPASTLAETIGTLSPDRWTIVYDQDGSTAAQIADGLQAYGYGSVFHLSGGLDGWLFQYDGLFLDTLPVEAGGARADGCSASRCLMPDALRAAFVLVIDLRTPEDFADGHLVGAQNVEPSAVGAFLLDIPTDTEIVVYDQDGTAGDAVAQQLRAAGYSHVKSLLGGLDEWIRQFDAQSVVGN